MKYFVVILLAFLIFSTFIPVAFTQLQNQREEDRKEREEEDEEKRQNELVVEVARQREEARQLQANVSALEPCPASAACEPPAEPPASCDPARVGFGVICPDDLKRAQEQGVVTRDIVGNVRFTYDKNTNILDIKIDKADIVLDIDLLGMAMFGRQ